MTITPSEKSLTEKEERLYQYICTYFSKHSRPPTYEEMRKKFGYSTVSSVQNFILQLKNKGYLRVPIGTSKKRALEIVDRSQFSEMQSLPLEGVVAAGRLTEAVQNREYVDVPRTLLKNNAEYFALKVKGDSMIDDCIMDGDLVIIRRQSTAQNGQTVVALVDDEATIKKFFRRTEKLGKEKTKEIVELVPANPRYKVIQVRPDREFKILEF